MSENLRDIYESALEEADARPDSALAALRGIVLGDHPNDTDHVKLKEQALEKIVAIHVKQRNSGALKALLAELRPLFAVLPKAKTAKLVRTIVDALAKIPDSTPVQLQVCTEMVEWARSEKRTFLRQHLQVRLATLRFETQDYTTALDLIGVLLSEIKRLDDKLLLVHIHLLESRVHHALRNLPRSKAALTAAKTAANSIYIPPGLQAEIDLRSGILNAEEKDYKTAYSYFFEAFEQFNNLDDPKAVGCMKYMLLCKIMTSDADHVPGIISSKAGLKYTGPEVDAMKAVAKAYQARSLADFQSALNTFKPQLQDDPIVSSHLRALYDSLLEQNLSRLIEPFSRVEVAHIAELISLPVQQVEARLSQMILDKKMLGTLDQGSGSLEIFEPEEEDKIYPGALEIISNMGRVVDTLFARSQKLVA